MPFNENSRVKIPALVHLSRLNWQYVSVKETPVSDFDLRTNMYFPSFKKVLSFLNNDRKYDHTVLALYYSGRLSVVLDADDKDRQFYDYLQEGLDGVQLIDLKNAENNIYEYMTELPCGRMPDGEDADDTFRPHITLFVNGLPLAFIEVKKPNNKEGFIAEQNRMAVRNANRKFRRFINITQLMIFSNNQEYDETEIEPVRSMRQPVTINPSSADSGSLMRIPVFLTKYGSYCPVLLKSMTRIILQSPYQSQKKSSRSSQKRHSVIFRNVPGIREWITRTLNLICTLAVLPVQD
ncbi:MAG: type I restriction enzyme HsdR N-terminal domain-containing protein [Treponema sp.]|nr:type I restriction enzyme HsdR N-terminal domain-containing protein [Treponema sp.]